MKLPALRLLPLAIAAMGLLAVVKVERMLFAPAQVAEVAPGPMEARAQQPRTPSGPAAAPAAAPTPAAEAPSPAEGRGEAERALLEALRGRRQELDRRGEELAQRELLLAAAERRFQERVEEMRALQARLEAELRARDQREEAGIRQLVRVYEAMRPRDAAIILDELEMPVVLQVLDRMREAKAAPVLAAMRPDRARAVTAELSRLRSRAPD
jgi:flagellar motility protein MotE (MotC chaperone)